MGLEVTFEGGDKQAAQLAAMNQLAESIVVRDDAPEPHVADTAVYNPFKLKLEAPFGMHDRVRTTRAAAATEAEVAAVMFGKPEEDSVLEYSTAFRLFREAIEANSGRIKQRVHGYYHPDGKPGHGVVAADPTYVLRRPPGELDTSTATPVVYRDFVAHMGLLVNHYHRGHYQQILVPLLSLSRPEIGYTGPESVRAAQSSLLLFGKQAVAAANGSLTAV